MRWVPSPLKVMVPFRTFRAPLEVVQLPPSKRLQLELPQLAALALVSRVPLVSVIVETTVMESCRTQVPPTPLNVKLLKGLPLERIDNAAVVPVKVTVLN